MDSVCQPLAVRFVGQFRYDETVPLIGRSTRIGSHPACHIVLPAEVAPASTAGPGSDPSPVLWQVLHGRQGTLVRNWSHGGLLNGQPFTDATLSVGDRLSTGEISLEIVPVSTETPLSLEPGLDLPGLDLPEPSTASVETTQVAEEPPSSDVHWRPRNRPRRYSPRRGTGQPIANASASLTSQVDQLLVRLQEERDAFEQARQTWNTKVDSLEITLDQQTQHIAVLQREIADAAAELQHVRTNTESLPS